MHLIVAEKNISARRIASILAGKRKVHESKVGGISQYCFDGTCVIGLKGHVVEVDFAEGYSDWRSESRKPRSLIDAPTVKVPTEKKIVALLQQLARKATRVTIATDFDTEGELIGKEAYELVRAVNPTVPVDRVRFSAITPGEITQAFASPTGIDFALASAGETRQIVDLMWGASLTRFLSLAARRGGSNILSVGRVQSPTLAMIVDREREIEAFRPEKYWQLRLITEKNGEEIEARHATSRFHDRREALAAKERSIPPLVVTGVKEGEKVDRAPSPFDTTTFIVAAARLGFSAANAMRIAEDLYMNGYISYPRTDNTVYPPTLDLSSILKTLLPTAFRGDVEWVMTHRRPIPTRGQKTSTDHPPIHPTGAATREELGEERWKVYELVVRRFLATLSPDARWKTMKVMLSAGGEPYTVTGGQIVEPGWRKVYPFSAATETILPPLAEGEVLPIREVKVDEKETQPPPRFTQARLIQRMEELGLGTKSTRHEVIQKLISRKYVEGNPLRPTLVGRAVIESLENHAGTITRPEMTRTLEEHMQQIKERVRESEDVVQESRGMLHRVFDELEAHEEEIGEEIREQTAEELKLGPCPVCGHDIRIRHARNQTQFVGCTHYPECTFNIGLPGSAWGYAVRTDEVCPAHGLHHVRLVRKGARPWEIGCPLCHQLTSLRETLALVPSAGEDLAERMGNCRLYSVQSLLELPPGRLSEILGIPPERASQIQAEAARAMDLLRRRSDCRKFIRARIVPRRGRNVGGILRKLSEAGINGIDDLARADPEVLRGTGLGQKEVESLLSEARRELGERALKDIGIPPASLKKYLDAGYFSPESLLSEHPLAVAEKTGISPDTVYRHVEAIAQRLGKPVPARVTAARFRKGREDLLSLPGMTPEIYARLLSAGVYDRETLHGVDETLASARTGLPVGVIRAFREAAPLTKKKRSGGDIIQI
ncbi:MAG: DNA topoisomerase I [Methanolinea sp.]|nr:DNA topoisomerase I [Methanolinea sp.]